MENKGKHPIIANGQYYIEPLSKKFNNGPIKLPHEYDEAKKRLCKDIIKIQENINKGKEVFLDEKVLCIRLEPKFEAKSHVPSSIVAESKMKLIGGRKYTINNNDVKAKMYFVRTNDQELSELKNKLEKGTKDFVETWKKQICTIKSIDLLQANEKTLGFSKSWDEGVVEVVIHPLGEKYKERAVDEFFEIIKVKKTKAIIRTYEDGITFVCMHMNKNTISLAKNYNPLRSIKPIRVDWENQIRMTSMVAPAPQLPGIIMKSNIKVGVFDGGVQRGTTLLDPYVEVNDMVEAEPTGSGLEHGSNVCGAVLYGTGLIGKTEKDVVDNPKVSVESFRVFPAKGTRNAYENLEMYTTIDIIEKVVKERTDIKLFNLSFGPSGAIIDDEINRFTYVCDRLTYDVEDGSVNPLFCVAVGNDGQKDKPLDRIQSPSDMVNGLAVGAYSISAHNDKYRSEYSCVGPGREGAKIKPDILEFGGSIERPFIAVKPGNEIMGVIGTSFAAPVVAGKIGQLMALSNQIVPHLGRAMLIHSAEAKRFEGNINEGFGFCVRDINEILNCSDKKVTILYEGEIVASSTLKLPIFAPGINNLRGSAEIKWTICTIVNPNMNDVDAYTNNCIEDTFYPNDMIFSFRKKNKSEHLNLLNNEDNIRAKELINQGYSRSDLPVSKPAKRCFTEADLRNKDFKWDTIIRKNIKMRCSSMQNPFISLHAIGRDEYEREKIRYYAIITIDVPKYVGSLYDNILQTYNNLTPIKIQNQNRIMARVN